MLNKDNLLEIFYLMLKVRWVSDRALHVPSFEDGTKELSGRK